MSRLRNGYQISTKLNFNKCNEIRNKNLILQSKINYEDFTILQNKLNMKTYPLIELLGITVYKYGKMVNDVNYETDVKDPYILNIVNSIKFDLKYKTKTSSYHYISKIKNMCEKMGITVNQFAEYYNKNPKHYKFNLMIIEKSSKGFWIGTDMKIPDEFINKYYNEIVKRLTKIINKYYDVFKCNVYTEDLINETILILYEQYGNIVHNFYFDITVLLNILMVKAKYCMFNIYRKKYKKENTISYQSFYEKNNFKFKDFSYDPQSLLELK